MKWFPVGAEWYYDWGDTNWGSHARWHYVVEKDTVVEGENCSLIRCESKKRIRYDNNGELDSYWVEGATGGDEIVYEDNGCVYYYFDGKFRKIFDFSVNVGDSIDFEWKVIGLFDGQDTSIITVPCYIEEITSETVNGTVLKKVRASLSRHLELPEERYFFVPREFIYLEKAGSEIPGHVRSGLFPYLTSAVGIPEEYYRLICYHDADVDYIADWWQEQGEPCEAMVSNPPIANPTDAIRVYPNPVKDQLTISGENGNTREIKIILYDAAGKSILEKQEYLPCTLNTGHLLPGIYYVRISDGTECITTKKIIKS
jgi:hypothetical protein